jgi:peptide-methionine (S)-S-oxide reductase
MQLGYVYTHAGWLSSMKNLFLSLGLGFLALSCQGQAGSGTAKTMTDEKTIPTTTVQVPPGMAVATFGNGCFWCTEAVFEELKGVQSATSGYSGGHVKNPAYREVGTGRTGHAEVLQIIYDPKVVSFEKLLEVFWQTHDPTTLNRQGADVGTQYRSAIFYHTEEQRKLAAEYKQKLDAAKAFDGPIVTEITPFSNFYVAEDYHQEYFKLNGDAPYCQFVVRPKVEKFRKVFAADLK